MPNALVHSIEHAITKHQRLLKIRRLRIKRWLKPFPRRSNIHRYPIIKRFEKFAKRHTFFWSYKRPNIRAALYVGSVITLLPLVGLQIIIGFFIAWIFRANLTITVALQFLSNVFTAAPIYILTYSVGMMPLKILSMGQITIANTMLAVVIGGVVCGLALGLVLDLLYQLGHWQQMSIKNKLKALLCQHSESLVNVNQSITKNIKP